MSGSRLHSRHYGAMTAGMFMLAGLAGILLAPAQAQTDLGGQRIGTSSGTFLKVPIDARSGAMAGATSGHVSGPAALFTNPAGLGIENERGFLATAINYPADIPAGAVAVSFPFAPLRGALGFGMLGLGATMDETDEYHPLGTGREFSYTMVTLMVGASRALTDKLSFGATVKAYREDLGAEVGGPSLTTWLLDVGAIYFVGYRDARIGLALSNFGPDLSPDGTYVSRRDGTEIRYERFSPPTFFRFSLALDPINREKWKAVTLIEMGHPADNREALRLGAEVEYLHMIALRAGYDFSADALHLHTGFGARVRRGPSVIHVDYAFSEGGYFGDIHRWTAGYLW